MTKRGWQPPALGRNFVMPESKFFHTDSWKGGLDVSMAPENSQPGQSFEMQDMEVTHDDRMQKAPGVALDETLTHAPSQMFLHAGFQYASDLIFLAPPYVGVKNVGATTWWNASLQPANSPYGYTNFAGVLLLTNGTKGIYARLPHKNQLDLIPSSVAGFGLTVFADRVVVGGAQLDGKLDFMGIAWNDSSGDYKGWDIALGAAGQSLIGTSLRADRFQAFGALGFDTLTIVNRRSIWIGVPTGDEFQPIRFSPRLESTGASHAATVVATEFGVVFLSDDGVRIFTGSDAPIISEGITRYLGPIIDTDEWSASFDPARKRYYLHGPTGTFVYDLLRRRWFRWTNGFKASAFFPAQGSQITWGEAVGTWGSQTLAWWQLLPQESGGQMYFVRDVKLGHEAQTSYDALGQAVDPLWYDRVQVPENHDVLMTATGTRVIYESPTATSVEVHLPDKPDGNYELVTAATLPAGTGFSKRAWVPLIHTGRSIGAGIRLLSGNPRIRRVSVEYQETALPWELETTVFPEAPEAPPEVPVSDAIVKPRILYVNGYDNGSYQAFRDVLFTSGRGETNHWSYVETGGSNGKGYLLTDDTNNDSGRKAYIRVPITVADVNQVGDAPISDIETNVRLGGMHVRFNLFGQTITDPLTVLATFATSTQIHTKIEILPDRTVRASTAPATTHQVSTVKVPADGWFVLEKQWCISRRGNITSGFILCKLFTLDNIATGGETIISAIGIKTQAGTLADSFAYYAFGSQCDPTLQGLRIGVDDAVVYGAYGDKKRFINDTRVGAAWPIADTSIQSDISYSWSVSVDAKPSVSVDPPTILSGVNNFGLSDRWRNASRIDLSTPPPTSPGFHSDTPGEWIADFHGFGQLSTFSTPAFWTDGPLPYLGDSLQRNYFADAATDFYNLDVNDSEIVQIEGVQPFVAQGRRAVVGTISPGTDLVALGGPHDIDTTAARANLISRSLIRSNGVVGYGRYNYSQAGATYNVEVFDVDNNFIFNSTLWSHGGALPYTINPYSFIDTDPDGNVSWLLRNAAKLRNTEVGIGGSFDIIDQTNLIHPARYSRWLAFDVSQLGLQYAYHVRTFVEDEHPPFPPRAGFGLGIFNDPSSRRFHAYPAHLDWDGTVVSAVLDLGDGSDPIDFLGDSSDQGSLDFAVDYTFAFTGTHHITLTVTDNDGLVTVYTYDFVCPNNDPVANFEANDAGGNAVDFVDLSTDGGGTVVAWAWTFGDSGTSSVQNPPTHTYAAPGVYHVTLAVTDNDGATNMAETDITVPLGGAGDCDIFAV